VTTHRQDPTRTVKRRIVRHRPDERPYLIGIAGEHAGRIFPLGDRDETAIGRTEDCEIRLALDDMVSRRHACLRREPEGGWLLRDLDSLNGTRVNGREVADMPLRRGDWVELGESTTFKFDYLSDEEKARLQSGFVDGLTECWNRACFDERLPQLVRAAHEAGQPLSLLMVDVDHFKRINDTHGHPAGDHALRMVGETIRSAIEARAVEALACRYGGEEFAVLLPRAEAVACHDLGEALRRAIGALELQLGGQSGRVTASLGGATLAARPEQKGPATGEDLVSLADDRLLEAKRSGRDRCICG
jgi:diguanylate cyclase (GGDEF)-like protein